MLGEEELSKLSVKIVGCTHPLLIVFVIVDANQPRKSVPRLAKKLANQMASCKMSRD